MEKIITKRQLSIKNIFIILLLALSTVSIAFNFFLLDYHQKSEELYQGLSNDYQDLISLYAKCQNSAIND